MSCNYNAQGGFTCKESFGGHDKGDHKKGGHKKGRHHKRSPPKGSNNYPMDEADSEDQLREYFGGHGGNPSPPNHSHSAHGGNQSGKMDPANMDYDTDSDMDYDTDSGMDLSKMDDVDEAAMRAEMGDEDEAAMIAQMKKHGGKDHSKMMPDTSDMVKMDPAQMKKMAALKAKMEKMNKKMAAMMKKHGGKHSHGKKA